MNRVVVDDLSFSYPAPAAPVLDGITLTVDAGEVIGLVGPPGSGKTTLCMALAGLVPSVTGGTVSGTVAVAGDSPVGIVFDDPGGQLTQLRVLSEVADPLRTRGAARDDVEREARLLLARVGLNGEDVPRRWVWELSEGQQVLLALAATLATRPQVLVLDAVMGHLDAAGRDEVLRVVREETQDRTIVLVEQDVALLADVVARLVVLVDGKVIADASPVEILADDSLRSVADLETPVPLQTARRLNLPGAPLTMAAFTAALADASPSRRAAIAPRREGYEAPWAADAPRMQMTDVDFAYPDRSPALRGITVQVRPGEVHAVLGHTGAGKSTVVRLLAGLLAPIAGRVVVDGADTARVHPADLAVRVATVLQDADRTLSQRTVRAEIGFALRQRGRTEGLDRRIDAARRLVGLPEGLLDADPILLPRAHRRLVALAAALVVEPTVVLLDQPNAGLSPGARRRLSVALAELRDRGIAVLFTEHDVDVVSQSADTVTVLDRGVVALQGAVAEVFRRSRREQLRAVRLDLPQAGMLADEIDIDAATVADLATALARRGH